MARTGCVEPLYGTPRSSWRKTLGPRVYELSHVLGRPYLPHQQHIADVGLEIDPDTGQLAYSRIIVIGPRQVTGKTELMLPVMTHRCLGFVEYGPQRVLYSAQNTDKAREKWRDVHVQRLRASSLRTMQYARLQRNTEAIIWNNGSMWSPGSTTRRTGGTGDTLDLGVIDEAWAHSDNSLELSMRPAMMTRDSSQLWILSMIPGLSRAVPGAWKYLERQRQVARERVEHDIRHGTALFDYTALEDSDPGDPETWYSCMPGLGHTVREDRIREDFEDIDLIDFCAEYLGWAPGSPSSKRWTLVKKDIWTGLIDPNSTIERKLAISFEMNQDRTKGWIGAAGMRPDGDWHCEIIEPGYKIAPGVTGVDWMEPRGLEIIESQKPKCVVIDPRRPASSLIVRLKNSGVKVITPDQNAIAAACGRFYDYTGTEPSDSHTATRIWHLSQPDLDDALAHARKLDHGLGMFTFVQKGTSSTIAPLYAVVLALHGSEIAPDTEMPDIYTGSEEETW